jgi:transmembrane sensor
VDDRNSNEIAVLALLERIFAGEASAAERAELARWLAEDPARQAIVDALRARWGGVPPAHDVDGAWARMSQRMRPLADSAPIEPTAGPEPAPASSARPFGRELVGRRRPWTIVAAAAAAAVIAAVAFRLGKLPTSHSQPPAPHVYATASGQRAELRLPDGTHVLVAPESHVRVAADFGKERRDVYVEGEAYFEVVHDSTRPFTVFAGNASTHDVGTAFAVRSSPGDRAVRVVVREGKVAMSGAGLLGAGDVGRLGATGEASVRHHANVTALLGWTQGKLAFEDAPLAQVLSDLGRWYGVNVELGDSALGALPFTGSLRGAAPAEAVQLVAGALGLRVERMGSRTVVVRR